jgi:hypothetical protein
MRGGSRPLLTARLYVCTRVSPPSQDVAAYARNKDKSVMMAGKTFLNTVRTNLPRRVSRVCLCARRALQ